MRRELSTETSVYLADANDKLVNEVLGGYKLFVRSKLSLNEIAHSTTQSTRGTGGMVDELEGLEKNNNRSTGR
jgi:hypothetical protein